jgi:hypothetical protein
MVTLLTVPDSMGLYLYCSAVTLSQCFSYAILMLLYPCRAANNYAVDAMIKNHVSTLEVIHCHCTWSDNGEGIIARHKKSLK